MTSSSDEGEIIENGIEDLKATSLPSAERISVDRKDRHTSRHSSPEHEIASKHSNSPRRSRSPRGSKRAYDERDRDYYDRRRTHDKHRSRYDDSRGGDFRRAQISYDDIDSTKEKTPNHHHDGRDRRDYRRDDERRRDGESDNHAEKRRRRWSRSPRRGHRDEPAVQAPGSRGRKHDRHNEESRHVNRESTRIFALERSFEAALAGEGARSHEDNKKSQKKSGGTSGAQSESATTTSQPEPDYEEPLEFDEEAEIQRRRKRREEILAKSAPATPLLLHAVGASEKLRVGSPMLSQPNSPQRSPSEAERSGTGHEMDMAGYRTNSTTVRSLDEASPRSPGSHNGASPGNVDLLDESELMNTHAVVQLGDGDGPSAADYDPTHDMKEDERRDEMRYGQVVVHGEPFAVDASEQGYVDVPTLQPAGEGSDGDGDDFDMFAENFDEKKYAKKPDQHADPANADEPDANVLVDRAGGILEGDDTDGYYKIRVGEVLNNRYQVQATLGRGMFSSVIRALDMTSKRLVAVKIMRNNDALRKGGYTEITILQKLNDADPESRKHIVQFDRSFDYRGHLCMAFENLSLNLREVLRKFGNNVGINLTATRAYAYQTFVALAHMRKCSIIHADLKPDNILVSENRNVLKICDLGTAIDRSDAATAHTEITPYLVSRFYRAPEIILGMPYDYGVDMWSIGCTLYELYTGKILFTGDSNNQMLKAIMEIRGRVTPKLYKRGQLSGVHFDDMGQFVSVERDKVLGKTAIRTLPMIKPTRDLRTRLMAASSGMNDAEMRELNHFIDMLEQCLALNPEKRMKPADALRHPFFTARLSTGNRR